MPFVIMQLPGFGKKSEFLNESSWAYIRDAQLQAVKETDHASLVVTIDLGEEKLHPKEKSEFGRRAALTAWNLLAATGPSAFSAAPIPETFYFIGATARVTMMNSAGCLRKQRGLFRRVLPCRK
jgi:sialate O-acetylesterase